MARRLSSRLSVAAVLGAAFVVAQSVGCGGGDTNPGGGGGDDTGIHPDGTSSDADSSSEGGGDTGIDDGSSETTDGGDDGASDGADASDTGGSTDGGDTGGVCTVAGCGTDSDCDGIADTIEGRFAAGGATDTDKDGTPDYLDLDSDNDGIPDKVEWRTPGCDPADDKNDADGDGTPNFQDLDSDGNGLPDKDEACPPAAVLTALSKPACVGPATPYDFDGDGTPDWVDFDNDHDSSKADKTLGLADKIELANNAGVYVGLSLDTDGDGIPDVYDVDSDNDFILDLDDGTTDTDGDGKPAFRDIDSDGDGVPDKCEARAKVAPSAADYLLPLLDTNGDGINDYLDLDSDSDFLADGKEDKNGNCIVDTDETDRLKADTDGDGVGDLAEVTLLGVACAKDPTCTPAKAGKFYFIEPYSVDGSKKPSPTSSNLALATNLKKGDVVFVVDTTISMNPEMFELKQSLATTIIPGLAAKFTDLGIGLAAHDDYPVLSAGNTAGLAGGSLPFYIPGAGSGYGYVNTDSTKAVGAATAICPGATSASCITHSGGDTVEAQVAAMSKALSGLALNWTGSATGLPADSPPAGTFGAVRFRTGALPIIIPITDAGFHNGKRALTAPPTGVAGDYDATTKSTYTASEVTPQPTSDDLVTTITTLGAKMIGVAATESTQDTSLTAPYGYLAYLADKTGSLVPPSVFGGFPAQCKTGLAGSVAPYDATTLPPDGPVDASGKNTCRLVFHMHTDGRGLGKTIIDGVSALLNSISFDVHVQAYKDPADLGPVDPVDSFMLSIDPQPAGGTDPVTGGVCITFSALALADKYHTPKAILGAGDIKETITGLNPGKLYCFKVTPKPNTTVVPTTTPQTFKAFLSVVGDKSSGGSVTLGTDREVLFIVPPSLN